MGTRLNQVGGLHFEVLPRMVFDRARWYPNWYPNSFLDTTGFEKVPNPIQIHNIGGIATIS